MNEQIVAARDAINRAIADRDVAGIIAWLQPDYHVVTSGGTHRAGREVSAKHWADTFANDPVATYTRTPEEIFVNEERGMAQEHGRWTGAITTEEGAVTLGGVYAARWHRTEGGWRLEAEMFTALAHRRLRADRNARAADGAVRCDCCSMSARSNRSEHSLV